MAAPQGNQNAAKAKTWTDAIKWALDNHKSSAIKRGKALRSVAIKVVEMAVEGNKDAWQEIGNRLDGKPAQAITGPDGGAIQIEKIERVVVNGSK
jgi:hypothetical protein